MKSVEKTDLIYVPQILTDEIWRKNQYSETILDNKPTEERRTRRWRSYS
jgi:hypothetical protein